MVKQLAIEEPPSGTSDSHKELGIIGKRQFGVDSIEGLSVDALEQSKRRGLAAISALTRPIEGEYEINKALKEREILAIKHEMEEIDNELEERVSNIEKDIPGLSLAGKIAIHKMGVDMKNLSEKDIKSMVTALMKKKGGHPSLKFEMSDYTKSKREGLDNDIDLIRNLPIPSTPKAGMDDDDDYDTTEGLPKATKPKILSKPKVSPKPKLSKEQKERLLKKKKGPWIPYW